MIKWRLLLVSGLLLGGLVCAYGWWLASRNDPQFQRVGPTTQEMAAVLDLLDSPFDMQEFPQEIRLKDAFARLDAQLEERGAELCILIDRAAFKEGGLAADLYEMKLALRPGPRKIAVKQFIKDAFGQLPGPRPVFLVCSNHLEITTEEEGHRILTEYRRPFWDFFSRKTEVPVGKIHVGWRHAVEAKELSAEK